MSAEVARAYLNSCLNDFNIASNRVDLLIENGVSSMTMKDEIRKFLTSMSKIFLKVSIKTEAAYENLSRIEAREVLLACDLETALAEKSFAQKEVDYLLLELHNLQLKSIDTTKSNVSADNIKRSLEEHLEQRKWQSMTGDRIRSAIAILTMENLKLKSYISNLQDELYGARMAAKYLDTELAGRIQQIQLLCHEMDRPNCKRLWSTLESEILLHRHKTAICACRGRLEASPGDEKMNRIRHVSVYRSTTEVLGISITGGLEYGVPIIISEIIPTHVAHKSGAFFIGDTILSVNGQSLCSKKHRDAVQILGEQQGKIEFELLFLQDDSEEELGQICIDNEGKKFRLYDETRVLPSRFLFQVQQRMRELQETTVGPHYPDHQRPVMKEVAEFEKFLINREATRVKIESGSQCEKRSNGPESTWNIYESYIWRPCGLGALDGGGNALALEKMLSKETTSKLPLSTSTMSKPPTLMKETSNSSSTEKLVPTIDPFESLDLYSFLSTY